MKLKSMYAGLIVVAAATANVATAGTPIPEQFHGVWGTAASCKAWVSKPAQRLGAPEEGADITKNAIELTLAMSGTLKIDKGPTLKKCQ